MASNFCREFG
ncbi:hypothetical protein YPPY102_1950, partial [Yersinia pestis PY-102]